MSNCRFLYHNGVVLEAPPVTTFLESHTGAYTTTRTINNGTSFLFWERHMKRLSSSIRILLKSNPELLFSSGSSPRFWMNQPVPGSSIYDRVNGSMSEALKSVVVKESERLYGEELAVTVLVTGNVEKLNRLDVGNNWDFLDVWLHIGAYSPLGPLGVGENAASLALVGRGRDVAAAKYSDWVRLRKPLEKFRPPLTTELLLSNDGDHLLEGCITNFFVVCRRVKSSENLYGGSLSEFEVQTAPITDGVLAGVIRDLVIEVCLSEGIPYRERAPSWSERELWEEAFITTCRDDQSTRWFNGGIGL
ncbi:D-aminoacid aminotransferase-like PLP-dependent enzymes superfamily protein [Arabidopsis thaliana]|uniref:D-aminoacid aminotransferase-like PLP-dependent enzymes superfamily protein n=2 Tax=Arabidopsis thaliana TaxID=3702 RepID=F4JF74_ARATH|nr:D-aminoacid aminotransferase-like PLP-dependent enzymes superfamily protein [Arabidopsis thaliana]AEE79321.1 D-aminoacid aminotransferase-like PLP-dependent enzymes superfamily protein [Arabidopsis thaliana]|eukprot:NP_974436.1 D-aminoacid aminotransferase-like PLP-dependent enzymes superfamily protein [Arabidopsis thaliana]